MDNKTLDSASAFMQTMQVYGYPGLFFIITLIVLGMLIYVVFIGKAEREKDRQKFNEQMNRKDDYIERRDKQLDGAIDKFNNTLDNLAKTFKEDQDHQRASNERALEKITGSMDSGFKDIADKNQRLWEHLLHSTANSR